MHNFDDLQKRCKKYRVKQALKYILVIFVLLLAMALYLSSIIDTKPPLKAKAVVKNSLKKPPIQEAKRTTAIQTKIVQKKHPSITTKKYSLQFLVASKKHIKLIKRKKKLLESLGFKECKLVQLDNIHLVCNESNGFKALESYIELAKRNHIDYYVVTRNSNTQKTKEEKKKEKKHEKKKEKQIEKSPTPLLKVQNTNIQQLQKKFTQAPNYNIAIIIARSYYKKGAFKNAVIWAKKANRLDKSDAESWIIYAKSLYALGQDEKARQLVHIYLQYENSEEVDKLLQNWERN